MVVDMILPLVAFAWWGLYVPRVFQIGERKNDKKELDKWKLLNIKNNKRKLCNNEEFQWKICKDMDKNSFIKSYNDIINVLSCISSMTNVL